MIKLLINVLFHFFIFLIDKKTQEIGNSIISDNPFSLRYVPDQYKTQQMCDQAANDFLASLKIVPEWFVISKMIKILFTAL